MTSSSSPGVSLKQEGISYLAGSELPAVIINVQRGGPGLGNIAPAQGDYFQSTRGGGHGDYRTLCLAPSTVQEICDLVYAAFDLADRYRNPVLVLSDGMLGQMMEPTRFDHLPPPAPPEKPWALTGEAGRPRNTIRSYRHGIDGLVELNERIQAKYARICEEETRYEQVGPADADIMLVAYGTPARICRQVVEHPPSSLGLSVALFRPITLWPFPYADLARLAEGKRGVLSVEMSSGQLVEDVRLAVNGTARVELLGRMGGHVPTAAEIAGTVQDLFA
jgi:2-oxoglutarate ferredoxin oxidoreductase subunit alpha